MELIMHEPPSEDNSTQPDARPTLQRPARPQISDISPRGNYQLTGRPERQVANSESASRAVANPQPTLADLPSDDPMETPEVSQSQRDHEVPAAALDQPVKPKRKHKLPVGIISVAIIVTALLAGGMIYALTKSTSKKSTTNQVQSQAPTVSSIKSTDVDAKTQAIINDLNGLNSNTDFGSTGINNQALGL